MNINLSGKTKEQLNEIILNAPTINKCNAICEICKRKIQDKNIIQNLELLTSDSAEFWNQYKVKDFACAAVYLLTGKMREENERVDFLIASGLNF